MTNTRDTQTGTRSMNDDDKKKSPQGGERTNPQNDQKDKDRPGQTERRQGDGRK